MSPVMLTHCEICYVHVLTQYLFSTVWEYTLDNSRGSLTSTGNNELPGNTVCVKAVYSNITGDKIPSRQGQQSRESIQMH